MSDIANNTDVPYKTIANYYYGRNSLPGSMAYNVVEIEHFLNVDGRILTGSLSIDQFYEEECKRIETSTDPKSTALSFSVDINNEKQSKLDFLKRIMQYYYKLLDSFQKTADE